jgi:hypothetical protein
MRCGRDPLLEMRCFGVELGWRGHGGEGMGVEVVSPKLRIVILGNSYKIHFERIWCFDSNFIYHSSQTITLKQSTYAVLS